jgi:nucleotide-binding universal stress UspA family protein
MDLSNIAPGNMLIAVDGSAESQSSARLALHLARLYQGKVYGLFVVDSHLMTNAYARYQAELDKSIRIRSRAELYHQLKRQGELALSQLVDHCLEVGVAANTELAFGNVAKIIKEKSQSADFLALGRRGRGHTGSDQNLGRNFREILHSTTKPILVGGADHPLIRKILLTYPDQESLKKSMNIASLVEGSLFGDAAILESQEHRPGNRRADPQRSPQDILSTYELLQVEGKSVDEIKSRAIREDVDLLILAGFPHHSHFGWSMGGLIETILQEINIPILIT